MTITQVRIYLRGTPGSGKLLANATIVIDDAMKVSDIRIIALEERNIVAMPSRKQSDRCPKCRCKNTIDSKFCNACGVRLHSSGASESGLHMDLVHPITTDCRAYIEKVVLEAYEKELERSKLPGYRPAADSGMAAADSGLEQGVANGANGEKAESH
jgi:stage V sporulation protein G